MNTQAERTIDQSNYKEITRGLRKEIRSLTSKIEKCQAKLLVSNDTSLELRLRTLQEQSAAKKKEVIEIATSISDQIDAFKAARREVFMKRVKTLCSNCNHAKSFHNGGPRICAVGACKCHEWSHPE
jgi:molecular chaperone GrpE (heat shock protein)